MIFLSLSTYHSFAFCLHIVSSLSRNFFFSYFFRVVTDALKEAEVGVVCV